MWWIKKVHEDGVEEAVLRNEIFPKLEGPLADLPVGTKSRTLAREIAKAMNTNFRNKGIRSMTAEPIWVQ